jgi:fatty acid desaturase
MFDGLQIFALIILITIAVTIVGVWIFLGMLPGQIAKKRNHPQADAINVCGWWGAITMGLLMPLAFIWAHTVTKPSADDTTNPKTPEEAAT